MRGCGGFDSLMPFLIAGGDQPNLKSTGLAKDKPVFRKHAEFMAKIRFYDSDAFAGVFFCQSMSSVGPFGL